MTNGGWIAVACFVLFLFVFNHKTTYRFQCLPDTIDPREKK